MPTLPGEHCMRCAAKCDVTTTDGWRIFICPRGHGEQGRVKSEEISSDVGEQETEAK